MWKEFSTIILKLKNNSEEHSKYKIMIIIHLFGCTSEKWIATLFLLYSLLYFDISRKIVK